MNYAVQIAQHGNLLDRPKKSGPKPKKALKRSERLRAASPKRRKELHWYSILRGQFLAEHPVCAAGPKWGVLFTGCTHTASQIHHKLRRGPHLNDTKTFVPICANCHRFLETHANIARAKGLLA